MPLWMQTHYSFIYEVKSIKINDAIYCHDAPNIKTDVYFQCWVH